MSIEQKLQTIFSQQFQIKRMVKQISLVRQSKDKLCFDMRMIALKSRHIEFIVTYQKGILKKYKKMQNLQQFEIRIIAKTSYPAKAPLIYCMSDSMIDLGIQPFRDYSSSLLSQWTTKNTIVQAIKLFIDFVDTYKQVSHITPGQYMFNQIFEIQKIFSFSFVQTFPIKIKRQNMILTGFLLIVNQVQIVFLEQNSKLGYLLKDIIKLAQIVSIFKLKNNSTQLMLEVKKGTNRFGLAFMTDDKQNLVNCLVELLKISHLTNQNQKATTQQKSQTQSDSDQSDSYQQQYDQQDRQTIKIDIEQVKQTIVLYQSLVDTNMTSQNISSLVQLLRKAVQYYSAIGLQQYQIYLKKLKIWMNNQMAMALVDSASVQQEKNKKYNISSFKSIIDLN